MVSEAQPSAQRREYEARPNIRATIQGSPVPGDAHRGRGNRRSRHRAAPTGDKSRASIAAKIGCTAQTLHEWVKKADRDSGRTPGIPADVSEKQVEAESRELSKLNQQLEQRVADQVSEIERMGRLRRFLTPQVADLIVASGTEKQLGSHRREITALFCDLRGFTGFSENADPEDVSALLREYHAAIGEKIIKYSGTLERYAGDGVMALRFRIRGRSP